jgi:hypothetical protein
MTLEELRINLLMTLLNMRGGDLAVITNEKGDEILAYVVPPELYGYWMDEIEKNQGIN